MEWWYMPDQSKYFSGAQKVRELNLNIFSRSHEVGKFTVISIINFWIISSSFIETINSIDLLINVY